MSSSGYGSTDSMSHASSNTSSNVRDVVSGSEHNEASITRAPQQYLDRFTAEYINGLETIPVTPEAPWDERGEILLRDWMVDAKKSSKKHRTTAYRLKRYYRILSISVIVSAGIVFLLTSLFPCTTTNEIYKYIKVFASFTSLIVANISSFYDYGPKYQSHFQYEGYYMRYFIDIQEILATDVDFRPPKDKTVVEYRERMGNLITSAPET